MHPDEEEQEGYGEVAEPKKEEFIYVRTIKAGEKMCLVEYFENGQPKRTTIPIKNIKDGKTIHNTLKKGTPYGIPFEELNFPQLTAQDIGNIFRNHGLWTPDDFRLKPQEVNSALMSLAGKFHKSILTYIKNK